jgi:hypothetical protein
MNEVEGLVVRRVAVEMEQREGGGGHAKSKASPAAEKTRPGGWRAAMHINQKNRPRRSGGVALKIGG